MYIISAGSPKMCWFLYAQHLQVASEDVIGLPGKKNLEP